jgi:hypothetical protein
VARARIFSTIVIAIDHFSLSNPLVDWGKRLPCLYRDQNLIQTRDSQAPTDLDTGW